MTGATDLMKSERGVFVILLVIAVTVLAFTGKVTPDDWLSYTKWLALFLVAGKTISHAVETLKPDSTTTTTKATATLKESP